jgi:hypothetical protein
MPIQKVVYGQSAPQLRPDEIFQIRFLGGKFGERLSNIFEAQTVGQIEYLTLGESSCLSGLGGRELTFLCD